MKVTIKESPDVVIASGQYGFPCGETDCYSSPDCELKIRGEGFEFLMPVCATHAELIRRSLKGQSYFGNKTNG